MDNPESVVPMRVSGVLRNENESDISEESGLSELPDKAPEDENELNINKENGDSQRSRKINESDYNSSIDLMLASSNENLSGIRDSSSSLENICINSDLTCPETLTNNETVTCELKLPPIAGRVFECSVCEYFSFSEKQIQSHVEEHIDNSSFGSVKSLSESGSVQLSYYTGSSFRSQSNAELITEDVNAGFPYKCDECSYETHETRALLSHLNIHSWLKERTEVKSNDLSSESEKTRYFLRYRPSKVRRFGNSVIGQSLPKTFFCNHCQFSCDESCTLFRHQAVHATKSQAHVETTEISSTIFYCWHNDCSFFCDNLSVFKRHQEFHEEKYQNLFDVNQKEAKFNCLICGFSCAKQEQIILHESIHSESSQNPEDFEEMRQSKEKTRAEKFFRCSICSFICIKQKTFLKHMSIHSKSSQNVEATEPAEKEFKCDVCPFACKKQQYLVRHLNEHLGRSEDVEKPNEPSQNEFRCSICPAVFEKEKKLKSHEKCHAALSKEYEQLQYEQKVFRCTKCSNSYFEKRYLDLHQHTHNEQFKCLFCGKGFKLRVTLRKHMRVCKMQT